MSIGLLDEGQVAERIYDRFKSGEWWLVIDSGIVEQLNYDMQSIEEKFFAPKTEKNAGFELYLIDMKPIYLLKKSLISRKQMYEHLHLPKPPTIGNVTGDVFLPRLDGVKFKGFTDFEKKISMLLGTAKEAKGD